MQTALKQFEPTELQQTQSALEARTSRSRRVAIDRTEVINGAMAASGKAPPPIFVSDNDGAHFTDLDGNRYLDTCMGFGVHVLGHKPKVVEAAISDQIRKGWHFSLRNEEQLEYARAVQAAAERNERVVFCNTGTEATMYAIRAARAFTGRSKIALFDISYHGAHDSALVWETPGSLPGKPKPMTLGHGIPEGVLSDVLLLPYKNSRSLDSIREHKDELAAVLVEPVQGSRPDGDVEGFLTDLRRLCDELGIILIFDEVLTGFRLAYGGAQERFGIPADISTYGKAAGGGLPVGIVAGRRDIMDCFGDFSVEKGIFFGGTFSGNPLTTRAGLAMLQYLDCNRHIYDYIDKLTTHLTDAFNGYCEQHGFSARIVSYGSMWQVFFNTDALSDFGYDGKDAESAFYLHCLEAGVFIHATHRCYFSAAHTMADADRIIKVLKRSLTLLRTDGLA